MEDQCQTALKKQASSSLEDHFAGLGTLLELGDYKDVKARNEELITENGGLVAIGNQYGNGQDITQDYNKAMEWYQKAAELGNAAGMNAIGLMYRSGYGISKDYDKAME